MKALILPLLLGIAGLAGGVGAGMFLAPPTETEGGDGPEEGARESPDDKARESDTPDAEFARLNNQFIVPVVQDDRVNALVVLSVTLEVDPGGTVTVFAQEPRIRDRFLRVMFDHANIGGFDTGFTQSGTMTLLRTSLMEAAVDTLGDIVRDVLIIDMVRQEV